MSGRRSGTRFVLANNEGMLRVAWDVSVSVVARELVAISTVPATVGECLTLEMIVDGQLSEVAVRVEESLPIVVARAIRHRIRLSRAHPSDKAVATDIAPEQT